MRRRRRTMPEKETNPGGLAREAEREVKREAGQQTPEFWLRDWSFAGVCGRHSFGERGGDFERIGFNFYYAPKMEKDEEVHIVMFPFFAFGHISPFVELANKLTSCCPVVRISFFGAAASVSRIETMLNPTANAKVIPLTLPHVDGLPQGVENTSDTSPETHAPQTRVRPDATQIKTLLANLNLKSLSLILRNGGFRK
ncbi:hypothetical protein E3N88_41602 [Mikania micrantha]|uniref:Uncharacterized protein n=1 Tax=Mikania micrantha TaxID=192012 RepID=A0A5N6LL22_9ASTR|nr:hypothetical protein E3N88_41602 [Mikania micrantha]